MLAGSVVVLSPDPWNILINTARTPTETSVWGTTRHSNGSAAHLLAATV